MVHLPYPNFCSNLALFFLNENYDSRAIIIMDNKVIMHHMLDCFPEFVILVLKSEMDYYSVAFFDGFEVSFLSDLFYDLAMHNTARYCHDFFAAELQM